MSNTRCRWYNSLEYPDVPEWMRVSEYYARGSGDVPEILYAHYDNIHQHEDNKKSLYRYAFVAKHYNRDLGCDELSVLFGISPNDIARIACVLRKRGHDIPIIHRGRHSKKISEMNNETMY